MSSKFIHFSPPTTAASNNIFLTSLTAFSFTFSSPFSTLQFNLPFCNLICPFAGSNPWKVPHCSQDIVQVLYQDLWDFNFHDHLPSYLCFLNVPCSLLLLDFTLLGMYIHCCLSFQIILHPQPGLSWWTYRELQSILPFSQHVWRWFYFSG